MIDEARKQELQDINRCKAKTRAGHRCGNTAKYEGYCGGHNYLRFTTSRSPKRRDEITLEGKINRAARKLAHQTKSNATRRKIEHSITAADIESLILKSKSRCSLTGVQFEFSDVVGGRRRPHYPSVDRINCDKGYTLDNIRIVTAFANLAMNEWGEFPLKHAARELARRFLARSPNTPEDVKELALAICEDK